MLCRWCVSRRGTGAFFVDAFWLASTTFPGIELNAADKRQLTMKVAEDLGSRYGIQSNDKRPTMMGGRKGFPSKSLFETRLIDGVSTIRRSRGVQGGGKAKAKRGRTKATLAGADANTV